ncbi:hypothetical protein [Bradyrhizobium erythrophlei]|uniref:hypothetical protein n=1 Tax=Bradyrhizobium erythrophlei TaxID=1437360 RepID=UPI0012EC7283|nr:hypothetical protein [Bradyrhizobium erythrophlei]
MATHNSRGGNRLTGRPKDRPVAKKVPAQRFPVESEIQRLEEELNAFNDRIAELESEGHRSLALDVLKVNALDFAQRIDELRSLLVERGLKN